MIKVNVKTQSNYPISAPDLKKHLRKFFEEKGIVSDAEVNVSLVGVDKMKSLARKYLGEMDSVHNVLTFPANEVKGDFFYPPGDVIQLGEIVICYPEAFEEAKEEEKMVDDWVFELATHGGLHLLGIHHD